MHEASRKFPKEWNSKFLIVSFYLFSPFIEDRGKNKAAKKNYSYRVVRETFHCVEEKRKKESTVRNLTKLCSKGMMKKKTGKHIRKKKLILWGVWRVVAYEYSFFIFLFIFSIKTINESAPVSFMKMLCFSWPKHWPTWKHFICFQKNIDIILINFSVIFRMSS